MMDVYAVVVSCESRGRWIDSLWVEYLSATDRASGLRTSILATTGHGAEDAQNSPTFRVGVRTMRIEDAELGERPLSAAEQENGLVAIPKGKPEVR